MFLFAAPAIAQSGSRTPAVDLGAFTLELTQFKVEGPQTQMVIWAPTDFMVQADLASSKDSLQTAEDNSAFLNPYIMIAIERRVEKSDGSYVYATEHDIRINAAIVLSDGAQIAPLQTVPPEVAQVAADMKAGMVHSGGANNKYMYILVFPATTKDGKQIVDTSKRDNLTLLLRPTAAYSQETFVWHTPFDATHPMAVCPYCGEPVSAKWSYCPWCGKALLPLEQKEKQ